nr:DUF6531 domain-containing protein [Lysobacter dokdonensis]
MRGNPVRLPSGLKVEEETDFASDGEMGLFLTRMYGHRDGMFGARWRSNFDYSLEWEDRAVGIRAVRPNGSVIWMPTQAGGWRQSPAKPLPRIEQWPQGWIYLFNEAGGTEIYDQQGRVHVVRNERGVGWHYVYAGAQLQRIDHTSGRSVRFGYTNGELTHVTDPVGSVYRYAYHRVGHHRPRLVETTLPGSPATRITYHALPSRYIGAPPGNMSGKSFDGLRYSTFIYERNDEEARVVSTEHHAGVERHSFAYSGDLESTTENYSVVETNPLGHRTTRRYLDGRLVSVEGAASSNCGSRDRYLQYDANGQPNQVTNFAGAVTTFDHDSAGRLIRKTEAAGTKLQRARTFTWAPDRNRVMSETLEGSASTTYTYLDNGRLASTTVTDFATGAIRGTTYAYTTHSNGLLSSLTVDGPTPGEDLTHQYNASGDLIESRNTAGHATRYEGHNGRGQPARIVEPSGAVTEYEYDQRGRVLVERTFPNGSPVETRYIYGASGLLDAIQAADGSSVIYHYDAARRLVQEDRTEPGGSFAVRRITYNAMSQPLRIEIGRDP